MSNTGTLTLGTIDTVKPHLLLLDEALFKEAVTRERKRSNRSGLGMALVLISLPSGIGKQAASMNSLITKALVVVASDLDTLGWFEESSVIGLIMPELNATDLPSIPDRLENSFRSTIAQQGNAELAQRLSITVRVYPNLTTSNEEDVSALDPLLHPDLLSNRLTRSHFQPIKRGMDIVFSAMLLTLLLPLFAIIAVLVKLSSPGPVFFKQLRVGHLLKLFTMYKFRSMYSSADQHTHQNYVRWFITASNQEQTEEKEKPVIFKLTNDARVTSIGRFLRRTSLDELPQLWNVLIGDMSLVGPRPPIPYELQQYKPWHKGRLLEAKPGMTGLWQVVGRSRTTFDEMVRLDLQYARTMSLWCDIKILLATPAAMITGKGAC